MRKALCLSRRGLNSRSRDHVHGSSGREGRTAQATTEGLTVQSTAWQSAGAAQGNGTGSARRGGGDGPEAKSRRRGLRATRDPLSLPPPDRPPPALSPTEGAEHPATPRSCRAARRPAGTCLRARGADPQPPPRPPRPPSSLPPALLACRPPSMPGRPAHAQRRHQPLRPPGRPLALPGGGASMRSAGAEGAALTGCPGRGRTGKGRPLGPAPCPAVGRRGPPAAVPVPAPAPRAASSRPSPTSARAAGEGRGGEGGRRGVSAVSQPSRKGGPGAGRARSGGGQPAIRGCRDPVGAHLKAVTCRRLKNTGRGAEPAACRCVLAVSTAGGIRPGFENQYSSLSEGRGPSGSLVFGCCKLTHARMPLAVLANPELQQTRLNIATARLRPLEIPAFSLQYLRDKSSASLLSLSPLSHLCSPGYLGQLSFSCFSSLSGFLKSPTGNNFLLPLPLNLFLHNPPPILELFS